MGRAPLGFLQTCFSAYEVYPGHGGRDSRATVGWGSQTQLSQSAAAPTVIRATLDGTVLS